MTVISWIYEAYIECRINSHILSPGVYEKSGFVLLLNSQLHPHREEQIQLTPTYLLQRI